MASVLFTGSVRPSPGSRRSILRSAAGCATLLMLLAASRGLASDHADPIDPFSKEQLEAGITDLFVFPVTANGAPAPPFQPENKLSLTDPLAGTARTPLTDHERRKIDSLIVILCVRRALTQSGGLNLDPFTYRVHIDHHTPFEQAQEDPPKAKTDDHDPALDEPGYGEGHSYDGKKRTRPTPHEAFLRYGGWIEHPDEINEDVIIEFRLDNRAVLKPDYPKYFDADQKPLRVWDDAKINVTSGVFDDPFIFPAFFGTNIVAMVIRVPMSVFPKDRKDFLIWATSHAGSRQIDHVGRSLRTQNPRFELLNTLHPQVHAKAILEEHEHPSLMRDIALRFNFAQAFAYRKWDQGVPDVMIYSTRNPVGFPNGRLLTDDVAAMLAQYGDTLLYELSYQHNKGAWPRQTKNDQNGGEFLADFPYLLPPQKDSEPVPPPRLSMASRLKLLGIAAAIIAAFILENWLVARWYHRRKSRRAYAI